MIASSHRKQFKGEINNITTQDLAVLDYEKTCLEDRKKFINEKYAKVKSFYDTYITGAENEEYYKVGLKTTDNLSSEINIFKNIERDADYLLNSSDVISGRKQKEYKFLLEDDFKRLLQKERMNLSLDDSEVMEVLEVPKRNNYIVRDIEIKVSDFSREETSNVLKCYEAARVHLKSDMKELKEGKGSKYNLGFLKRNLGSLKADMIDSKKMLQGIRDPANRLGDESGMFYSEIIDYTNPEHIKAILRTVRMTGELEPNSDLSHIAYDMELTIQTLKDISKLDDIDIEVIECFNGGYTYEEIASEINRDKKVVCRRLKRIFGKISTFYKNI